MRNVVRKYKAFRTIFQTIVAAGLSFAVMSQPAAARSIAITFDDVPKQDGAFLTADQRTVRLIAGLQSAEVKQAAFFINPSGLANEASAGSEDRIRAYVAAGHVIANHSFSHPSLSGTTVEAYLADIDMAANWLHGRAGYRPWFRYPFLDEGRDDKAKRDAVRHGLASRGLTNGYVTVDAYDWHIEGLASDAIREGKVIDFEGLRSLYVDSHVEAAEAFDAIAVEALGRSPAHVLLLHETDIAALFIRDLVEALREEGWEIITVDEAYRDPINALAASIDVPSTQGTLTEAIAWSHGLPAPRWWIGNDRELASERFNKEVLAVSEH